MANILFKRGLHANLPTGTSVIDGAFYLTTDSHRLYAGINNNLVDLNQYIQVVANVSALEALTNVELGDFAYVTDGNILAIYQATAEGSKWVQINRQATQIVNSSLDMSATGSNDNLAFKVKVTDSNGDSVEDTVNLIGSNMHIAVDGDNITFTGKTYSLSGAIDDNALTLTLTDSDKASSSVSLTGGDNVTITGSGNAFTVAAHNTTLGGNNNSSFAVDGGTATVTITDSDGNSQAVKAENKFYYNYGSNGTSSAYNQGTLSVYTIDEIDDKFKTLNPMSYKGAVDSTNALNAITKISEGDTYMASASFDISSSYIESNGVTTCKIGDLFIATGTEDASGYITSATLKWTYIPAGDDSQTDTTYEGIASSAANTFAIEDSNDNVVGKITLKGTEKISVTSEGNGKELTTTFTHAAPGATDATKQTTASDTVVLNDTTEQNVITGVTVDSTGHVNGVITSKVKAIGYDLKDATVAAASNVVTVTNTLTDDDNNTSSASFKLDVSADDSLKVSTNGTTIALSLEWGSF